MQRFVSSLLLLWALVVAVTSGLSAQPTFFDCMKETYGTNRR